MKKLLVASLLEAPWRRGHCPQWLHPWILLENRFTSSSSSSSFLKTQSHSRSISGRAFATRFLLPPVDDSMSEDDLALHASISKFVAKRRDKNTTATSKDHRDLALDMRRYRSSVGSRHLAIVLGELRTRKGAELSLGLTELLQEINNIISQFGEALEAEDVVSSLRKLCATHSEVRNIMATLTRVILSGKYRGDTRSVINAFLGLKNKRGYLYQVQNLSNALRVSLQRRQNICFNFNCLSRAMYGLGSFSAENSETRDLLLLLKERTFMDVHDKMDAYPGSIRRTLQGMLNMNCEYEEVRSMLSLVVEAIEASHEDVRFNIGCVSRIFSALQNKKSETPEVREILTALYNRREMMKWHLVSPSSFSYMLYGFHNMSSDEIEVRRWVDLFASSIIESKRMRNEKYDKYALSRMFYGLQRMSNVSEQGQPLPELDHLLGALMSCVDPIDREEGLCPVTTAQVLYGLQRFRIRDPAHIAVLRGMLKGLVVVADSYPIEKPIEDLMAPYQSIAILRQQKSPLLASVTGGVGEVDLLTKAYQAIGKVITDRCASDKVIRYTKRSEAERRLFGVASRVLADKKHIVATFNDILFGFETDIVFHITEDRSGGTLVRRTINFEIDGSNHLTYRQSRFCDLRDQVLKAHGVKVVRANLVLLNKTYPSMKELNDKIYSMIDHAIQEEAEEAAKDRDRLKKDGNEGAVLGEGQEHRAHNEDTYKMVFGNILDKIS